MIKKIAVLGSGVMGSRIACHFAGAGLQVLLLDIQPKDLPAGAKPAEKNKIVNDALAAAIKSNPSPVYTKDVVKKIAEINPERVVYRAVLNLRAALVLQLLTGILRRLTDGLRRVRRPGAGRPPTEIDRLAPLPPTQATSAGA